MNWNDLQFFIAVARAGQIERAAPAMQVDATTVSRRLRRLETDLGQRLFEQNRNGQRLTAAGQRLLERAEAMEVEAASIALGGTEKGEGPTGVVRVSTSEAFGTWIIAHHLADFHRQYPNIGVDLVATSGFLSPSRRETDVAILLARPRRGPLITRKLTDYGLGLFAARDYLASAPPIHEPRDLSRHSQIGYIDDLIYAPELRYLGQIAPGLTPNLRSSSINAQYRLCASGAGVAVLPFFVGDADHSLVRLLPDTMITRSFWLVTHSQIRQAERVSLFIDWLVKLIDAQRDRLKGDTH